MRLPGLPPVQPDYIHHLFKAEEMLAMRLSVMHNLYFYNKLTERIRAALDDGTALRRFPRGVFTKAGAENIKRKIFKLFIENPERH